MKAHTRELLRAVPFRPFVVRTADGQEFRVDHPDFVFASPTDSPLFIEKPDGSFHRIAALLITIVEEIPVGSEAA
jgi:hypothetical protein